MKPMKKVTFLFIVVLLVGLKPTSDAQFLGIGLQSEVAYDVSYRQTSSSTFFQPNPSSKSVRLFISGYRLSSTEKWRVGITFGVGLRYDKLDEDNTVVLNDGRRYSAAPERKFTCIELLPELTFNRNIKLTKNLGCSIGVGFRTMFYTVFAGPGYALFTTTPDPQAPAQQQYISDSAIAVYDLQRKLKWSYYFTLQLGILYKLCNSEKNMQQIHLTLNAGFGTDPVIGARYTYNEMLLPMRESGEAQFTTRGNWLGINLSYLFMWKL